MSFVFISWIGASVFPKRRVASPYQDRLPTVEIFHGGCVFPLEFAVGSAK
jgi:hypothetical protein